MDEDSEDKIRRNAVVASAFVLLAGWLDWDLAELADRVLGTSQLGAPEWRIWSALVAVLTYLNHRYAFTASVRQALDGIRSVAETNQARMVESYINLEILKFNAGKQSDFARQISLNAAVQHIREFFGVSTPSIEAAVIPGSNGNTPHAFLGEVHLLFTWKVGEDKAGRQEGYGFNYSIQPKVAVRIRLYAWTLGLFRSALTGQVVVPIVITLSGYGVAVYRLTSALVERAVS